MDDTDLDAWRAQWTIAALAPSDWRERVRSRVRKLRGEVWLALFGFGLVLTGLIWLASIAASQRDALAGVGAIAFAAALPALALGALQSWRASTACSDDAASDFMAHLRAWAVFDRQMLWGALACAAILILACGAAIGLAAFGRTSWPTLGLPIALWTATAIALSAWAFVKRRQLLSEIAAVDLLLEEERRE